jgi:hypothetical protein
MISGPYAICLATVPNENSDAISYQTLSWGYDTATAAFSDLASVAQTAGITVEKCVVVRHIEREEAEEFSR